MIKFTRRYLASLSRRYRTIMSYQCSDAPRVNYFSNPDVNYLGIFPTGTDTEDCSRAFEDNMVRCLPVVSVDISKSVGIARAGAE